MRAPSKTPPLQLAHLSLLDQPSLFGAAPAPNGEPLLVPVDQLDEDPENPRTEFLAQSISELAQDIAERGVLQPIVVSAADENGRYRIRFGHKRWLAAKQAGLTDVPVTVATRAHDAYDQVAENLKRHGLSPLELARFIRSQIEAGESNAAVAKRLVIDQTTVAHHLALLDLPPVLDAALRSGRCASPRTLYELSKLHGDSPDRVADLIAGSEPVTRKAVAALRDAAEVSSTNSGSVSTPLRPDRTAQLLVRANGLCERLDTALQRLSRAGADRLPPGGLAALQQRLAQLACRLGV